MRVDVRVGVMRIGAWESRLSLGLEREHGHRDYLSTVEATLAR